MAPFFNWSIHGTNRNIQWYYYTTASSTGNVVQSYNTLPLDDGKWHMATMIHDMVAGTLDLYVDGVHQEGAQQTHGGAGAYTNASAELWIGEHCQTAQTAPADETEISLFRIAQDVWTSAQVRAAYEAERGMFAANAKCLLQSTTTDEVLDVSVDPITGKVAVTQADSAMIWNGLAIDSEPVIATGGSAWEHNLLHGGDRVEINDANLYATIAARDLRGDIEILRGLKTGLSTGVDLSKAKAWIKFDGTGTVSIDGSFNVKSLTDVSTGQWDVRFAVPFKSVANMVIVGMCDASTYAFLKANEAVTTTERIRLIAITHAGAIFDADDVWVVVFGELENE